jgi:hypothetical protein
MRRCFILLLIISTFFSCEKEKDHNVDSSYFWTPNIRVDKGNKEAILYLNDPRPYSNYIAPGPSNPDYFKILISNNNETFTLFRKIDISTNSVKIKDLINGKPYYFLVTSHKSGYDSITSGTIMTIPSEPLSVQAYLTNLDFSIRKLSTSYDKSYMSFVSNSYDNSGKDILFYKTITSDTLSVLGEDAYNANWCRRMNRLVHLTRKKEGNMIYPYKMQLFEPETNKSTTLFEIQNN